MIGYYITVIRGRKIGYLAGPYACHDLAKSFVSRYREIACRLDPWCDFDAFGTSSIESDKPLPQGRLWAMGHY